MGQYYDVKKVRSDGKKLGGYHTSQPRFLDKLVAVCDRGLFELAVDVSTKEEFVHFLQQYSEGHLLSFDLYDFQPDTNSGDG